MLIILLRSMIRGISMIYRKLYFGNCLFRVVNIACHGVIERIKDSHIYSLSSTFSQR